MQDIINVDSQGDSQAASSTDVITPSKRGRKRSISGSSKAVPGGSPGPVELAVAEASASAMNSQLNLQMNKKINKIIKHPMFSDIMTMDPPQITSEEAETSGMQDLSDTAKIRTV